jgi:hypothetical protein
MATQIEQDCPTSLEFANLQPRGAVYPSPADWSDEVLYFLLPDRFSDGNESNRAMFDRANPKGHAAADTRQWMDAGKRFVGGNLRGVRSKLPYIKRLGATAIWLGPIWKQRADLHTYHGYGIQNFLDVDPHLGTRQDLRNLVDEAHSLGLRVLLDVIYNHSGNNWFYDVNGTPRDTLPFRREPYPFHSWRSASGASIAKCVDREDGVWPIEFQDPSWYTRCGQIQNWDEPGKELERDAEFRLGDFGDLKDFKLEKDEVLDAIIRVYQYWIALSDCDGFRIDTVKHVPPEISAIFCHDIRSFARRLGKKNFMLLGEVTGATTIVRKYVDPEGPNLDCILDIESAPQRLADFVKGHAPPQYFFDHFRDACRAPIATFAKPCSAANLARSARRTAISLTRHILRTSGSQQSHGSAGPMTGLGRCCAVGTSMCGRFATTRILSRQSRGTSSRGRASPSRTPSSWSLTPTATNPERPTSRSMQCCIRAVRR